jgi:hypothetical protein
VAKYAVPDADPFTFLAARFGLAAIVLALIALASGALWPASAGAVGHSLMAGGALARP